MKLFINSLLSTDRKELVLDEVQAHNNIQELATLIAELKFQPDIEIHYCSDDLSALIENYKLLESLNDYSLTNPLIKIKTDLYECAAITHINSQFTSTETRFFLWDYFKMNTTEINAYFLSVPAQSQLNSPNSDNLVYCNSLSDFVSRDILCIIADHHHILQKPVLFNIDIIQNKESLLDIIKRKRNRIFNLNPKHGENGTGNWEKASKLLCDRHQAKEMLDEAIGFKDRTKLYHFDKDRYMFIKFYSEGNLPVNQFHGFHVEPEDVAIQIPTQIQQKFNYRR